MPKSPNILFIITDQQYAGALSCAGNPDLRTPAMDRLAENGRRFERAYCPHPLCVPSRASFMTGAMPHVNGSTGNENPVKESYKGRGIGNLLAGAGYDCALAGKWHIVGATPQDMGLDVICDKGDSQVPLHGIEFMKRKRETPFFLMASFTNPHDICQVARSQPLPQGPIPPAPSIEECPGLPANYPIAPYSPDILQMLRQGNRLFYPTLEYSDDDWRRLRHDYFRLVEKVDAEIGVLLDGLRDLGLEEDTLVIFTSDHGDGHGAHNWNQKTALYEECIRIPFIVSQKGVTPPEVDRTHLVSLGLDLLPTLCDFAGAEAPGDLEGLSLRPLVEGKGAAWREELVVETETDLGSGAGGRCAARALLGDRYKYSVYFMGRYREQLVDLQADPGEMVNLVVDAKYRQVLDKHRQSLRAWCTRTEDPFLPFCA